MSEELEIFEGEEAKVEEIEEQTATELSDEELSEIAGGKQLVRSGRDTKAYCPWHNCYETITPCGVFTGKLANRVKLRNVRIWWCNRQKRSFYGPAGGGKYWADDGNRII